ncbi:MAG: DUF2459 domain-containing protein [Hymenobacter sp.]
MSSFLAQKFENSYLLGGWPAWGRWPATGRWPRFSRAFRWPRCPPPSPPPFPFIHSNGVHTDLVVPLKTHYKDWTQQLTPATPRLHDTTYHYVGIGWGDRGFYLDTPTWAELKARTAIQAGFWLGSTPMHTTYYREADLRPGPPPRAAAPSTPTQYQDLVGYVEKSFQQGLPTASSTGCPATATATTMPSTKPTAATASSTPATPGRTTA